MRKITQKKLLFGLNTLIIFSNRNNLIEENLQTILGAGGAIGKELAKILPDFSDKIRLVSCKPKYREVSKSMTKLTGLFIPIMKELAEMYYQNDRDYIFKSDKFEKNFDFKTTPYEKGIKEVVKKDFNKK